MLGHSGYKSFGSGLCCVLCFMQVKERMLKKAITKREKRARRQERDREKAKKEKSLVAKGRLSVVPIKGLSPKERHVRRSGSKKGLIEKGIYFLEGSASREDFNGITKGKDKGVLRLRVEELFLRKSKGKAKGKATIFVND